MSQLRRATTADRLLMAAGCVFAVVHGVSFPVLALVFGSMTNTFLNLTDPAAGAALLVSAGRGRGAERHCALCLNQQHQHTNDFRCRPPVTRARRRRTG